MTTFRLRIAQTLAEVPPETWDACANPPGQTGEERFNPFITHAFLHALETTGCVGGRTGWSPAHVLIESDEKLVACAPAYFKSHSQGEYVFDHALADAFSRAGGRYYPKLLCATPFTPVNGRRLLVAADAPQGAREAVVAGLRQLAAKTEASSLHVNFADAPDMDFLRARNFSPRKGQQFHFFNRGYAGFDDFLGALASRKRKAIRKEREQALSAGIEVEWVTGAALTEAHWDAFFAFYIDTGSRKWGRPYLTRAFFSALGEKLGDRVLLVMARRNGRPIAGALNLIGDDALYGRNWGCLEDHPCLHFELCYYQAIDFALSRGLKRVEAGAQGEHKLARGYEPVATFSAHEFRDPRLAAAAEDFFAHEGAAVEEVIAEYAAMAPFRKGESPTKS
ncbi:putative N-acyltransferase [Rhodoblastus acidophilus]|uniref:GNAT family N-acetyltransferase n=1 Tax=Rhodoblastus acidophilus TaxID=1074 RepID=UPI002224EF3D|nr:GNAT family N-acetyltransferase [Rhodoblastus acidophilus]MCW2284995.1 putative N-acyltransferase [Rhodoblastus acidophilus]MCW2333941.1 putative N-acyltransferase [Rhodoblastus acidophilus]